MLTRDDFIKRLRNDPLFRRALALAPSEKDRQRIIATTEAVAGQFFEALGPLGSHIQQDQSFGDKLQEALKKGATVVKESSGRPAGSGSNI